MDVVVIASSRFVSEMVYETNSVAKIDLTALARVTLCACFDGVVGLVVVVVVSPFCLRRAQVSTVIADEVIAWRWSW